MNYHEVPEPESEGKFPRGAAIFAVFVPLLVLLIAKGMKAATKGMGSESSLPLLIGGSTAFFLSVCGFVAATIALCCIGRYGRDGLLKPGIIGFAVNGLLVLVFINNFTRGAINGLSLQTKARESQRDVLTAARDVQDNLRKNFDPEMGITNIDTSKTRNLRLKLEEAATHLKGDDALEAKAMAAFLLETELAATNLDRALQVLLAGNVIEFNEVPDKDDFERRRRIVQNYQAANEKVRAVVTNAPAFYRAELKRLGMAPAKIEAFVNTRQNAGAAQSRLLLDVRQSDTRMTTAMLQMFDLMERNRGQWQVSSGKVLFDNARTASDYNKLVEELQDAVAAQVEAQRKIIALK